MNKRATIIATISILLIFVFSSCSGVIGGDGLYVYVDELNDGRYIHDPAGTDNDANAGYIVVVQEDKIFSLGTLENREVAEFEDGFVRIKGLPTGEYVVVVVLLNDQTSDRGPLADDGVVNGDVVGFKLAGVTVNRGPNYLPVTVGPGILGFNVGIVDDVEAFFNPVKLKEDFANVTVRLAADTIYVGGTGAVSVAESDLTVNGATGSLVTSDLITNGRRFTFLDGDAVTHYLSIILDD